MKKGFTLAEVLITLTIIGVIAALTIPNLITNYQKQQTIVGLKKAYSILSQAYTQSVKDNGLEPYKTYQEITVPIAKELFKQNWEPYLKTTHQACHRKEKCASDFNYNMYDLNHNLISTGWGGTYCGGANNTIVTQLSDGMIVAIEFGYHFIFVDINGKKGPNATGKDIFLFNYNIRTRENLYLYGWYNYYGVHVPSTIDNHCINQKGGDNGYQECGAKIMKDGWQIKDDYPW